MGLYEMWAKEAVAQVNYRFMGNEYHERSACLSALADAHGHNASVASNKAPRARRWDVNGTPSKLASTALTPKIRIGIYNGKTSKESKTPLRRAPRIKAAPMAPIRLKLGVPNASAEISTAKPLMGRFRSIARTGAAMIRGSPVVSQ